MVKSITLYFITVICGYLIIIAYFQKEEIEILNTTIQEQNNILKQDSCLFWDLANLSTPNEKHDEIMLIFKLNNRNVKSIIK